mmetsp:Transcript_34698/g.99665  ORF Transcript_34698/g.99665 Transcript_34698/m.99665 type:complete len:248 (-) Transcript_34698:27-770(-)
MLAEEYRKGSRAAPAAKVEALPGKPRGAVLCQALVQQCRNVRVHLRPVYRLRGQHGIILQPSDLRRLAKLLPVSGQEARLPRWCCQRHLRRIDRSCDSCRGAAKAIRGGVGGSGGAEDTRAPVMEVNAHPMLHGGDDAREPVAGTQLQDPRAAAQPWPRRNEEGREIEAALPDLGATVIVDSLHAIQVDVFTADYINPDAGICRRPLWTGATGHKNLAERLVQVQTTWVRKLQWQEGSLGCLHRHVP